LDCAIDCTVRPGAAWNTAESAGALSLDAAEALNRIEIHTRFRDFKAFHPEQAVAFKCTNLAQDAVDAIARRIRKQEKDEPGA
jgi:hypothetical protein